MLNICLKSKKKIEIHGTHHYVLGNWKPWKNILDILGGQNTESVNMIMILIFVIEIKCEVITKILYSCQCKYIIASYDYNAFFQLFSFWIFHLFLFYRIFRMNWKKNHPILRKILLLSTKILKLKLLTVYLM